jgi:hypothetical protein
LCVEYVAGRRGRDKRRRIREKKKDQIKEYKMENGPRSEKAKGQKTRFDGAQAAPRNGGGRRGRRRRGGAYL